MMGSNDINDINDFPLIVSDWDPPRQKGVRIKKRSTKITNKGKVVNPVNVVTPDGGGGGHAITCKKHHAQDCAPCYRELDRLVDQGMKPKFAMEAMYGRGDAA